MELGIGVPKNGLWLREDVDMKCNILATGFVKKTLKKAHATLVERLVEKAHIRESEIHNSRLEEHDSVFSRNSELKSPGFGSPLPSPDPAQQTKLGMSPYPNQASAYQAIEHRGPAGKAPYPYSPPMEGFQQPLADPRYSRPPPDPRYSEPPIQVQNSRDSYQQYQPHQQVELAPTEPRIAELPSSAT